MGDLSRSHNNKHDHWSNMSLKLASTLLLLSIVSISVAFSSSADGDQEHGLAHGNRMAANKAEHQLVKREAGRGRGKSCKGKRCNKKKSPKKGKKRTQKKNPKKGKKGKKKKKKKKKK